MAEIKLVHVSKSFGEDQAIRDVSLEVQDRELLVLLGPSGSGKSALLRLVAGLEEPSEGEIWIGGRLVNDVGPKDRDLALVFQNYALYAEMTVEENIAFALRLRKKDSEEIGRRVRETAEMLGLEPVLQRKPPQLSGAQRQRVALARALVREPAAYLMDEPLSNLAPELRAQARTELLKLHRRLGMTTLYATHDQVEAMTMGDRIAVLRDGHLQQLDTPLGLYNRPANRFVATFLGAPRMNFIKALVLRQNGDMYADAGGFKLLVSPEQRAPLESYVGVPVDLGLRPSDLFPAALSPPVDPMPGNSFTADLQLVEPLGEEEILHLSVGEDKLLMKVEGATPYRPGEEIKVVIDPTRLHYFDPDTDRRLA